LVGQPAARYVETEGGVVSVLTEDSPEYDAQIAQAEVLITGVGQAHFITPDRVSDGVVVFDAGASEDGGVVVGDVDPAVAEKASLFTPVPGGVGPITVAALLDNLVELIRG
jgi:methylenetetrahydrofolate dehydrogenase (NADP+)/methenyltetrahydrofolate cyclohydrolase